MGRGGNKGNRGRGRGRGRGGGGRGDGVDNRVSHAQVPKNNEKLEKFYNSVLLLTDEEREDFWTALKRELPNSFRFAGSKGNALAVQRQLVERYIPEISKISHYDGTLVEPPKPVPWYPDELAWWMTTPKNVVRKFPPFAAFQKYLVSETSVGNISRQEVVSMIPPLVMDLQPGMTVLDMCAAPGSKAAQLLEMVHRGEEARVHESLRQFSKEDGREESPGDQPKDESSAMELDPTDYGRATGLLIANDSDYKRSHMLIHQLKRLSSPNLIVTNHDATMYPSIKLPSTPENPETNRYLKFDRILCDVPCSGDGTLRKNVNLWADWNPNNALGLYVTQVRILVRALQMLKAGGRVVYSTCSMNPVENEAVICTAIERCGGLERVKLLPTEEQLPLMKRRPGLKDWGIIERSGKIWRNWEEVQSEIEETGSAPGTDKLVEGMFAPKPDSEGSRIPLEYCMRVYAHHQDTGGFFIAVLEKQSAFKARPEGESKKETESTSQAKKAPPAGSKRSAEEFEANLDEAAPVKKAKTEEDEEQAKIAEKKSAPEQTETAPSGMTEPSTQIRARNGQQFEEPFRYISSEHAEVQTIINFYKLSPRFPRDRFMVRNAMGEPAKTIYYTSALIRDILTENEGKGIKFIHGGVKMFMKQDVQAEGVCKWRIQSEGMPILEGYVGEERVVRLYKRETLRQLLIEMFPKVSDEGWKQLGEIGERVSTIPMGCCVLRIEPSDDPEGFPDRIVLPLWRSLHSLNLMLAKEDRTAMLLRMFNDTTPLVNNHFPGKKENKEVKSAVAEDAGTDAGTEIVDKMHIDSETVEATGESHGEAAAEAEAGKAEENKE